MTSEASALPSTDAVQQNLADAEPSVEKYFVSLNLPEEFQEKLAAVRDALSSHFGSSVGRPMRPSKYHLTLGVMEVKTEEFATFSDKILELVPRLELYTKDTNPVLGCGLVRKFGSGAVFIEIEDSLNWLSKLREMIEKLCHDVGAALYDSECFHVTIFRENTVADAGLPLNLTQLGLAPITVGAQGTRAFSGVYHGKVKRFQGRAGDKLLSP